MRHICWVCVLEFSTDDRLEKHKTTDRHNSLVARQVYNAQHFPPPPPATKHAPANFAPFPTEGENSRPDTSSTTRSRLPSKDKYKNETERHEQRYAILNMLEPEQKDPGEWAHEPFQLTFCQCILDWRVDQCNTCTFRRTNSRFMRTKKEGLNKTTDIMKHNRTSTSTSNRHNRVRAASGEVEDYSMIKERDGPETPVDVDNGTTFLQHDPSVSKDDMAKAKSAAYKLGKLNRSIRRRLHMFDTAVVPSRVKHKTQERVQVLEREWSNPKFFERATKAFRRGRAKAARGAA